MLVALFCCFLIRCPFRFLVGQETRGGTFRIKAAIKRSPGIRATNWTLDGCVEDYRFLLASVGGDEMREDRREVCQKILDHLARDDDWQTPLALASAVGSTGEVVRRHGNELFGENLIARQRGQLEGRGTSMALCAEPLALCFVLLKGCGLSLCTLIPLGRENPTGT